MDCHAGSTALERPITAPPIISSCSWNLSVRSGLRLKLWITRDPWVRLLGSPVSSGAFILNHGSEPSLFIGVLS